MKRISLLRHAKAVEARPGLDDHERPLSEKGQNQLVKLGQQLAVSDPGWDSCFSSSAARAITTAGSICKQISPSITPRVNSKLYTFDADELLSQLVFIEDDLNHPLIVGHNPALSDLTHYLSREPFGSLGTANLVSLQLDIDHWSELRKQCGKVLLLLSPKDYKG